MAAINFLASSAESTEVLLFNHMFQPPDSVGRVGRDHLLDDQPVKSACGAWQATV